jgi:hypothetical protein
MLNSVAEMLNDCKMCHALCQCDADSGLHRWHETRSALAIVNCVWGVWVPTCTCIAVGVGVIVDVEVGARACAYVGE